MKRLLIEAIIPVPDDTPETARGFEEWLTRANLRVATVRELRVIPKHVAEVGDKVRFWRRSDCSDEPTLGVVDRLNEVDLFDRGAHVKDAGWIPAKQLEKVED